MNSVVGNYSVKSNYQQTAFKGGRVKYPKLISKAKESFDDHIFNMARPMLLNKMTPEKSFEKLASRLKRDYYASKIRHFFDIHGHIRNLMLKPPKEYEWFMPKYNPQEIIDMGYEFAMKNKDNLEKLSLLSHGKNADYIKGMLKALKELGLVK